MTHSPFPWPTHPQAPGALFDANGRKIVSPSVYVDSETAADNAALIAAIPAMIEALEKIACNHVTEQPLWWQLEARRALASLPAPEAAPVTDGTYKPGDVLSYEMDETTRVGRITSHVRPAAAPTREETIEQCRQLILVRALREKSKEAEGALLLAADAILALKPAPHQRQGE